MASALYFYNANYNQGSPNGQYRYCWGLIELAEEDLKDLSGFFETSFKDWNEMHNFNLTSFNRVS